MTKLDWQKTKVRPGRRERAVHQGNQSELRQQALRQFVERHQLACFKCGTKAAEWAKATSTNGRPWAICVHCVTKRP